MDILFFLEDIPAVLDIVFKVIVILACIKYLKTK
jgi:hypothetical protein